MRIEKRTPPKEIIATPKVVAPLPLYYQASCRYSTLMATPMLLWTGPGPSALTAS
jgi:hypothetical protein